MIGHLRGSLLHKGFDGLIVEVGGVGYRIEVPLSTLARLPEQGSDVALFVHTYVREDALRLYGFESLDGLRLFERLIGVSGVGPRLALSALSHHTPEALHRAVINGDVRALTQISGVGKKTAERIIIDLADPLAQLDIAQGRAPSPATGARRIVGDLEDALRYLGYRDRDIRSVAQQLGEAAEAESDFETLLKKALKLLQ